ncbi:uncharacterized protein LOC110985330 [Acanthaster planci]|uniref:Uncharacterized protein LOC110985330 n=1 Tax=Acanthaster planci TaxID=133434 RepID=A0A8B7ZAI8_ACAPL|nr:uncharacterized protein LOC110985330 [Acanthaster planci]XP_022101982.1 uncharacterized protein LOC110985330 [Acanthaster planci]
MAFLKFAAVLLTCFIHLCASQSVDVEITVSSPSDIIDGESTDVTFSVDFTPFSGAASVINALSPSTRYTVIAGMFTSDAGDVSSSIGGTEVTLSSRQLNETLTDGVATTFSGLTAALDLTSEDCGNDGTDYTYFCVIVSPNTSGAGWSGVDTSNNTDCASLVCKAVVDLNVDTLSITNPDDGVIGVGAGQAIEFDVDISSPASSDSVIGVSNWAVSMWLSDADSSGTVVALTSVTLTSAQLTVDLTNGSSADIDDMAVTLDLTSVTCSQFSYSCVSVEPASGASWKIQTTGASNSNTACTAVTCGATIAQISLVFLGLCFLLTSLLMNQS